MRNIVPLLFLIVATVANCSDWSKAQPRTWKRSQKYTRNFPRQTGKIDYKKFEEALPTDQDPFLHTKELMEVLSSGDGHRRLFSVSEKVDTTAGADPQNFQQIIATRAYESNTSYVLHPHATYFSLDIASVHEQVLEITADSVHYCGDTSVAKGDFFVGTDSGAWTSHPRSAQWKDLARVKKGLILTRKVLSVQMADKVGCYDLQTETVIPFRLFESFRTESSSELPFSLHYNNIKPEGMSYDNPGYACDDSSIFTYGDDYVRIQNGEDDDFQIRTYYEMLYSACVSLNKNLLDLIGTNFNYNYDSSTSSASVAYDLGNGVTCSNCYAYMGVYIMAVIEYWDQGYMGFEAKLDGGIGYNIEIDVDNPSFSSSSTITLMSAASQDESINIPLGYGITLSTWFGGLSATLSGSVSATGSATMETGASASAYAGVAYEYTSANDYGWSFPYDASFSVNGPSLNTSDFTTDFSLNLELVATQNFELGWTYFYVEWIGADFNLILTGDADYSGTTATDGADVVSLGSTSSSKSTVSLSVGMEDGNKELKMFRPGETVFVNVSIAGFKPNEETMLFFSFHRSDHASTAGIPIMQTEFVVPDDGAAIVSLEWTIPWDERIFVDNMMVNAPESMLSVRASNAVKRYAFSPSFFVMTDLYSDNNLIIVAPIASPKDKILSLEWNPALLSFYVAANGNIGHGRLVLPENASFDLIQEYLDADGITVLSSTSYRMTPELVPNSGSAVVSVPTVTTPVDKPDNVVRYFLNVHAAGIRNMRGRSKGYLPIDPNPSTTESATVDVTGFMPFTQTSASSELQMGSAAIGKSNSAIEEASAYDLYEQRRALQDSCSSSCNQFSYSVSFSGTLTDVIIIEVPWEMGMSTGAIYLMEDCICINNDDYSYNVAETTDASYNTLGRPIVTPYQGPPVANFEDSYYADLVYKGETLTPNTVKRVDVASPSSNSGSGQKHTDSISTGEIVGITVVAVFALVLLVSAAIFTIKCKKSEASTATTDKANADRTDRTTATAVQVEISTENPLQV